MIQQMFNIIHILYNNRDNIKNTVIASIYYNTYLFYFVFSPLQKYAAKYT